MINGRADLRNHGAGGLLLCSATRDASLLSGMVPMYLLMSAFHSPKENLQHGRLDLKQIERDEGGKPDDHRDLTN